MLPTLDTRTQNYIGKAILNTEKSAEPKAKNPNNPYNWKNILKGLAQLYCLYVVIAVVSLYFFADKLALFPSSDLTDKDKILAFMKTKFNVTAKEVKFPAKDGKNLVGWYFLNSAKKDAPVVLVSHGNASNVECRVGIAAYLLFAGTSVFLYDYRGYGESQGEAHLKNLVPDARSAYDYLITGLHYKPEQIILYGESIGCGVTSDLAQQVACKAVILQSPFTSLCRAAKDHLFFLNTLPDFVFPLCVPALDNLSYVKKEHPPLLIIHGEKDSTLPFTYAKELYAAASEQKTLLPVPRAGHNDVYEYGDSGLLEGLIKFVSSLK